MKTPIIILCILTISLCSCSILRPRTGLYRGTGIDGTYIFTSSLRLMKNGSYNYSSGGGNEDGRFRFSKDSLFLSLSSDDTCVLKLHAIYIIKGRFVWDGFHLYKKQTIPVRIFSKIIHPVAYPHNISGILNRKFKDKVPIHY